MALTNFDYKVTDEWGLPGELNTFQNQYWIQGVSGTNSAGDLMDYIFGTLHPLIVPLLHTDVDHVQTIVENRVDKEDFNIETNAISGTATGEIMPRFVALSIRFSTLDRSFRHAYKRYGATSEGLITSGVPNATAIAAALALRSELTDVLVSTTGNYRYVQSKSVLVQPPLGPPRYELQDFKAIFTSAGVTVSTQNSRKR